MTNISNKQTIHIHYPGISEMKKEKLATTH